MILRCDQMLLLATQKPHGGLLVRSVEVEAMPATSLQKEQVNDSPVHWKPLARG